HFMKEDREKNAAKPDWQRNGMAGPQHEQNADGTVKQPESWADANRHAKKSEIDIIPARIGMKEGSGSEGDWSRLCQRQQPAAGKINQQANEKRPKNDAQPGFVRGQAVQPDGPVILP